MYQADVRSSYSDQKYKVGADTKLVNKFHRKIFKDVIIREYPRTGRTRTADATHHTAYAEWPDIGGHVVSNEGETATDLRSSEPAATRPLVSPSTPVRARSEPTAMELDEGDNIPTVDLMSPQPHPALFASPASTPIVHTSLLPAVMTPTSILAASIPDRPSEGGVVVLVDLQSNEPIVGQTYLAPCTPPRAHSEAAATAVGLTMDTTADMRCSGKVMAIVSPVTTPLTPAGALPFLASPIDKAVAMSVSPASPPSTSVAGGAYVSLADPSEGRANPLSPAADPIVITAPSMLPPAPSPVPTAAVVAGSPTQVSSPPVARGASDSLENPPEDKVNPPSPTADAITSTTTRDEGSACGSTVIAPASPLSTSMVKTSAGLPNSPLHANVLVPAMTATVPAVAGDVLENADARMQDAAFANNHDDEEDGDTGTISSSIPPSVSSSDSDDDEPYIDPQSAARLAQMDTVIEGYLGSRALNWFVSDILWLRARSSNYTWVLLLNRLVRCTAAFTFVNRADLVSIGHYDEFRTLTLVPGEVAPEGCAAEGRTAMDSGKVPP